MRKLLLVLCGTLVVCSTGLAKSHLEGIKIAVTNPTDLNQPAAKVVVPFSALRKVAPALEPHRQRQPRRNDQDDSGDAGGAVTGHG
jgi:hypothetical protein